MRKKGGGARHGDGRDERVGRRAARGELAVLVRVAAEDHARAVGQAEAPADEEQFHEAALVEALVVEEVLQLASECLLLRRWH